MLRLSYKRLWREAERDRRAAEKDLREADEGARRTIVAVADLLDVLAVDDHPNPEVRGMVRKLRQATDAARR